MSKAQSGIVPQARGRMGTANEGQNLAGCHTCGEEDISPNIEAFEISGQILCDECAAEVFEANSQFGAGA